MTENKGDLISREYMKKAIAQYFVREKYYHPYSKGRKTIPTEEVIDIIDTAPTVEPFEPDYVGAERVKARQRGYEEGYRNGMEIGKTLNPKIKQGEWNYNITAKSYIDNAPTVFSCNACKNMGNERECVDCHDYSNYVHYEERPQGEWNYIQAGMCVCPFCGAMPHKLYKNYCAKCGADMRKEDSGND